MARNLNIDLANIFAFSDSQVVFGWINHQPEQLKFVRNRVVKILQFLPSHNWFYVKSKSNPADFATCGISVRQFFKSQLLRKGPAWLVFNFESRISVKYNRNV